MELKKSEQRKREKKVQEISKLIEGKNRMLAIDDKNPRVTDADESDKCIAYGRFEQFLRSATIGHMKYHK